MSLLSEKMSMSQSGFNKESSRFLGRPPLQAQLKIRVLTEKTKRNRDSLAHHIPHRRMFCELNHRLISLMKLD